MSFNINEPLKSPELSKEIIDELLKEVGKKYRKAVGKNMPAELIIVGGASVMINYGFRQMTNDVDAIIFAASAMDDAIREVGDENNLPAGWLNTDFKKTKSYSDKLPQYSQHYRTFSNVLEVRTISSEYLIAMKLMSGREYKNDASDICGILKEEKENGRDISYSLVKEAATNLYGSWEAIPEKSRRLFSRLLSEPEDYSDILTSEQQNRELLIDFEKKYPGVENESNVDDLLDIAKQKNDKPVEETSNPHRGKHRIRDRLTGEYCWIKD